MPDPVNASQASDRIGLLHRLAVSFNSSLDLEEVLNRVIDEIISATRAERGFIMLLEPDGEFTYRVARGIDKQILLDPQSKVSLGIARKVVSEGQAVLTSDAQEDERFNTRRSIINLRLRSILCVPLSIKERTFGAVYVDNRLQSGIFTREDLELLSAIASNAAIAIENARLYQVAVEKGRMERDLQIVYQMQVSLLPKTIPEHPGWEFSAYWQPARQVGGDYYDFIQVDENHLGLVIADVADKGVPASFFMAISRTIVRTCTRKETSPQEIIRSANRLICPESTSGYFITLFFALLDLTSGELTYVNAGHPPPLLYSRNDPQRLVSLTRTGLPLGIDDTADYTQRTVKLEPGSFVICYTDGITEAMNDRLEEFDLTRLQAVLLQNPASSAKVALETIKQSVAAWVGSAEAHDDITLLLARRQETR